MGKPDNIVGGFEFLEGVGSYMHLTLCQSPIYFIHTSFNKVQMVGVGKYQHRADWCPKIRQGMLVKLLI